MARKAHAHFNFFCPILKHGTCTHKLWSKQVLCMEVQTKHFSVVCCQAFWWLQSQKAQVVLLNNNLVGQWVHNVRDLTNKSTRRRDEIRFSVMDETRLNWRVTLGPGHVTVWFVSRVPVRLKPRLACTRFVNTTYRTLPMCAGFEDFQVVCVCLCKKSLSQHSRIVLEILEEERNWPCSKNSQPQLNERTQDLFNITSMKWNWFDTCDIHVERQIHKSHEKWAGQLLGFSLGIF